MSNIRVKKTARYAYLFLVVILCYTFTLLYGWIPRAHSVLPLMLGWGMALVVSTKYFKNKSFAYFTVFFLVALLNVYAGDHYYSSVSRLFFDSTDMLLPALMVYGIMNANDEKLLRYSVLVFLWMIIINAIGSTFVETIYPGSIRAIHGQIRLTGDSSFAYPFYRFGLANYALPHALPTLIPVFVMSIKTTTSHRWRWFMIGVLFSSVLLTYLSGATTALLLAVVAMILSFATSPKQGSERLILLVVVLSILVFILSDKDMMLSILRWADGMIGGEGYFHSKIVDFEDLILNGNSSGDVEERQDLYSRTVNAIISSPLIGVNTEIGGHSNLIDIWGYLGLIGMIPWLGFIIAQIRMSGRWLHHDCRLYYYEGVLMAFLMLAIKSMAGWESYLILFTALPLITVYCELKTTKK